MIKLNLHMRAKLGLPLRYAPFSCGLVGESYDEAYHMESVIM